MKKIFSCILFISLAFLSFSFNVSAEEEAARLMRMPDINDGKIVFVYQEDLWTVDSAGGTATRLTVHDGMELYPKFSPDGKWIAFIGNYNGSESVFIIPSEGGEAIRLTYHPDFGCMVAGWTPDSQKVVFTSSINSFTSYITRLYEVSINGGAPSLLPIPYGTFCSYSPDGKKILFNNHFEKFWWWKRYKGSGNQDVWLYDKENKKFTRLTDYEGNDTWPMYGLNDTFYYVSEKNGTANIFAQSLKDKKTEQITNHNFAVKWPSLDADRKTMVYESDGRLYKLDTTTAKVDEVVVYAPCDDHFDMVEYINPLRSSMFSFDDVINGFDISPTGKRVVFSSRGDIFTAPEQNGDIDNLTQSSGARDQYPAWSPDGKYLAYVSDETGEDEIYLVHQRTGNKSKLTDTKKLKYNLKWSPDGKKILYGAIDNSLAFVDIASKNVTEIARCKFNELYDYNWAPDNKWVTYNMAKKNNYEDIYIYSVSSKSSKKITKEHMDYSCPTFARDGKNLIFISGNMGITNINSVSLMPEKSDPYQKVEDEEPIVEAVVDKKDDKKPADKNKKADKKDDKKSELKVEIDFKNIQDRIRALPIGGGSYYDLQAANKYYYYMKMNFNFDMDENDFWGFMTPFTLYCYDIEKQKTEYVTTGVGSYTISAKGDKVLIWNGRTFQTFFAGGKPSPSESVNLSRVSMKVDLKEEWKQIFNESWRMVRDNFYDPNMHGVDWNKIKEYYSALLPYIKTREDLNTLLCEMVGELNASHQGVMGGEWPFSRYYPISSLGAELTPDYNAGYYRFTKIYKGDKIKYKSPLDNEYVKIKEGDYLIAINGKTVKADDNYYKYLLTPANKITLKTNSKPSEEGSVETKIEPVRSEMPLRYKEWVDKNTEYVDKSSSDKIGYMHLRNMGSTDLHNFMNYLKAYRDKEGIIIDIRYNGGGWIDENLIDMLERLPYMTMKTRYNDTEFKPGNGFYGKIAVLINEYSLSDAEIFPQAVKARNLGKVIGVPTYGFCIAVDGHTLIDKGYIRKTFIGLWDFDGNMIESKGVQPDIYVENTPESEVEGKDLQLKKAVDYLKEEIKKSPRKTDYPQNTPAR